MNEQKLKEAFQKVKGDMSNLESQVLTLKKKLSMQERALSLNREIKKDIDLLKQMNLNDFVRKLDFEIDNVNKYVVEINKRTEKVNAAIEKFSTQLEVYEVQFADLKKKFHESQNTSQNTALDMKALDEHTAEFERLIDEKVSLENGSLRLELESAIATLARDVDIAKTEMEKKLKSVETKKERGFDAEEFAEMINEKVSLEVSSLRLEMQEEMARLHRELAEARKEQKSSPKKEKKSSASTSKKAAVNTVQEEPVQKGRVKKAIKWLFVDEDDGDGDENDKVLAEVKNDVKKK